LENAIARTVTGAVVNDDNFGVRQLCEQGRQRGADPVLFVERRNDDAETIL
jgi:hypothetical protein